MILMYLVIGYTNLSFNVAFDACTVEPAHQKKLFGLKLMNNVQATKNSLLIFV